MNFTMYKKQASGLSNNLDHTSKEFIRKTECISDKLQGASMAYHGAGITGFSSGHFGSQFDQMVHRRIKKVSLWLMLL